VRQVVLDDLPAAKRAVRMLMAKLIGAPYQTEVPIEIFDRVPPAAPILDLSRATLALVTTSGLMPKGNPDGFKSMGESRWAMYPIPGLHALSGDSGNEELEPIHGGYDTRYARENPNLVVPFDIARQLEKEGIIGRLWPYYIVTVGVGTSISACQRMGEEIASELHRANVSAAIFTST
jgi:glycine reductase